MKSSGQWMALAIVAISFAVGTTRAGDTVTAESYEAAQTLLASDPASGRAMLDRLARKGDGRAQLAFGVLLFEGRGVPQDRPLGLAFIKQGTNHPFVAANPMIGPKARAALQQYELQLTGSELVTAARLVAEMTAERDRERAAAMQAKLTPYTQEKVVRTQPGIAFESDTVHIAVPAAATDNPSMVIGCALDRRRVRGSCGDAPAPGTPGHCTGEIRSNDTPVTRWTQQGYFRMPELPHKLRQPGLAGTATLVAHVDSSGYVCSIIVATSSGYPEFDRSALASVRLWRFAPATRGGAPVEALHAFATSFGSD